MYQNNITLASIDTLSCT